MILKPEINMHNATSLLEYLKVLDVFLQNHIFTEIVMNKPHEVITQSHEGWTYHNMPLVDYDYCFNLAKLIASYSKQKLDAKGADCNTPCNKTEAYVDNDTATFKHTNNLT
jgi:type IV secretory pathway ATPase VirB11/archaellum biosynthesis ATPase